MKQMGSNFAVPYPLSGSSSTGSWSNWNLHVEVLVFVERGKPENPVKNSRNRDENWQQTEPPIVINFMIQTRATLMEASTLTTVPFLLPYTFVYLFEIYVHLGGER